MDPKTVAEALTKISQQYEASCKDRAAMEAALESRAQIILSQQKTIAARDLEISELKKQRDADLPRLAREIDGWKAKHTSLANQLVIADTNAQRAAETNARLEAAIADLQKKLTAESIRADSLIAKYDPQIQAEFAAKAEAERLRQIAELKAKLKALEKE